MATAMRPKSSKGKAKVFVVEDHPIVSQGLADLVNREGDLVICGVVPGAEEAMEAIASLKPDMVIVDLHLPGKSGLELVKDIKAHYPRLPVLVLSMHDESVYAGRALRAGALGYVMKDQATERVIEAIHKVLKGEIYVSTKVMAKIMREFAGVLPDEDLSPAEHLSDRELEVFEAIGHGLTTSQIAEKLHLSVKTIGTYREHIKRKLGLKNAAVLSQRAILWVESCEGI